MMYEEQMPENSEDPNGLNVTSGKENRVHGVDLKSSNSEVLAGAKLGTAQKRILEEQVIRLYNLT